MDNPEELIGKTFGDMRVISYDGTDYNWVKWYIVECIRCGYRKRISYTKLNHLTSCFHNNIFENYLPEYDNNIGLEIDDHIIVEIAEKKSKNQYYTAQCKVCGMTFKTTIGNYKKHYGTKHKACSLHIIKDEYIDRFKKIYSCMRYRTTSPNYNEYEYYGGRGINSDYFEDFMVFYFDMYESYVEHCKKYGAKNTTLDRIDPNGNYTKDNCRWATPVEQGNNKRDTVYYLFDGIKYTAIELCRHLKLEYGTVSSRLRKDKTKWPLYKCFDIDPSIHTIELVT